MPPPPILRPSLCCRLLYPPDALLESNFKTSAAAKTLRAWVKERHDHWLGLFFRATISFFRNHEKLQMLRKNNSVYLALKTYGDLPQSPPRTYAAQLCKRPERPRTAWIGVSCSVLVGMEHGSLRHTRSERSVHKGSMRSVVNALWSGSHRGLPLQMSITP